MREQCLANGKIVSFVLRNTCRWARGQIRSPFLLDGRERPHELFGRLKAEKVGSLPPNLVFFSVSFFSFSSCLFPGFHETYAHPKLKKVLKTKLKCVIPTFFSCFAKILAARTERIFLLGWSDPRFTLGTEPCAKVGSLQPNSVFCAWPN
jgi:hypothetical protein